MNIGILLDNIRNNTLIHQRHSTMIQQSAFHHQGFQISKYFHAVLNPNQYRQEPEGNRVNHRTLYVDTG